jgi:pyrimidine-nucleoside phosphorylase
VIRAVDLIERKRDGAEHTPDEIAWLVEGFTAGDVAAEQMSAWCMAVVFRGLSDRETDALCDAMVRSGETIDLAPLGRRVVDKHSTGGVGDKTTIVLAPLVAACGVPVAKMSGRALGHTGGTLDKLESIPGFRVGLTSAEMLAQVQRVGCAVVAQTGNLVPADGALYALRDVTGTVPAPALIATSVMSKKLAAGADAILLDVKVGDGAFARTVEEARELARLMQGLGARAGRPTVCELTRMDEPLGLAVGNALEVAECVETLRGEGPPDLDELVRSSAARLLALSDLGVGEDEGRARVDEALSSGRALEQLERWIGAQGGDPRLAHDPWDVLERCPVQRTVESSAAGSVSRVGARGIAAAAAELGAARARKEDAIDHAVGVVMHVKVGDAFESGHALATIHARDDAAWERAAAHVRDAVDVTSGPVERPPLILETIE